ncbi:hypothetical protein [Emticicia sp. C21]|uniref:hypothetical protein n=1 Tax=Emticicia sp. C21 TaxID=2302915 RepID=UPI000E346368|nr:hypothetical protein [Emticicia sp. C21]RFS14631.1 hypothetical protein D0T08_20585 [Emticicia sp. C21]
MKTSLLLIGFFLFIIKVNAQMGIQTIYNPYLLATKNKTSSIKNNNGLPGNKVDSVFAKNRTLFLQYIPKRKYSRTIIFADNSFNMANLNVNQINDKIDLERSKNRTKQLFFKMKMWRYFRE